MRQDRSTIIRDNYNRVTNRIARAAAMTGREPEDIRVVVVTKTQPVEMIRTVLEAGAVDLGENYIEEGLEKIQALSTIEHISWHMIGHLQSRKARDFCQFFDYLHSLDSLKLAERICRFAEMDHKIIPAWMEFNVSGEESKSGWNIADERHWEIILPDIELIVHLPNLNILGVMTVPPYSDNPEASRPYYQKLKKFQKFVLDQLHPPGFTGLSIGMSSDFEVAIQEGSTCVRIGQAILGPRPG